MLYSRSDFDESSNVTLRRKIATQFSPQFRGEHAAINVGSLETVLMELCPFREESMTRYLTQEACINKLAEGIKEIRCSVVSLHSKYNVLRTDIDKLLRTSNFAASA